MKFYGATSLDGFLAGPNDEMDWLTKGPDPEVNTYGEFIEGIGAVCMGSATYEWLLGQVDAWPYAEPTFVFTSRDLPKVDGDIRFVSGDPADHHDAMVAAADGKDIWIVGGGGLLAQCHAAGLVDELWVQVAPVALGAGKPLWTGSLAGKRLELTKVVEMGAGFVEHRYRITG